MSGDDRTRLVTIYKHYQDKLLQVTARNRSVLLRRIYIKHNFDLARLEQFEEGVGAKIASKALKSAAAAMRSGISVAQIRILADSVAGDEAKRARSDLKSLERNLSHIEEETGQQAGYIGFPFLEGHVAPDLYVRGPVILFPIRLERRRQRPRSGWFLQFATRRPVLNGALIASLRRKGNYQTPSDYEEALDAIIEESVATRDGAEERLFTAICRWLEGMLPLGEAASCFETAPLTALNRDETYGKEQQPLRLVNYRVMGSFPQADDQIYRDYGYLIEGDSDIWPGAVGTLLGVEQRASANAQGGDMAEVDLDSVSDSRLNTVLQSDSSQDEVILRSKELDLLVVRGPPGTGKSQVIANLIADAMSTGRRVLVVCQKRAALEMVRQRLGKVGLGRYVVLLAKELDDRSAMYRQLHELIEQQPAIQNPKQTVEHLSWEIGERVRYLAKLGSALHKPYFGGATAHKIYSRADDAYKPVLNLRPEELDLAWDDLDEFIKRVGSVEATFRKLESASHPWFGRRSFGEFGLTEEHRLKGLLQELLSAYGGCVMAASLQLQEQLVNNLDEYIYHPGLFKWKRKRAAGEIKRILGVSTVNNAFASGRLEGARRGVAFWKMFNALLEYFGKERHEELVRRAADGTLPQVLSSMVETLDIDELQHFDRMRAEDDKGLFLVLERAAHYMNADDDWSEKVRQEIYACWLAYIERENPILRGSIVAMYEEKSRDLANLMKRKRKAVARSIIFELESAVRPDSIYGSSSPEAKVWKRFMRELQKKRRVKPVRKMFEEYGEQLFTVAPCWLTSPESVSKVFPLQRDLFDLTIVDEASQLAVERTIPFLYRSSHVVVAGDEKQLPPFDLFQVLEEDDEDSIPEENSLLELAMTSFRTFNLRWHYRSIYQDLISFSNHAFYSGMLNVVPNVVRSPPNPPIHWVQCNGTWESQRNHEEAVAVLREIKRVWLDSFERTGEYPSVGIITFNELQQELIQDEVDKARDNDAEFAMAYENVDSRREDDRLFVKNIENVQGDERDIIIFSIGYAKDADGHFANRFGSLSRSKGENRLNVAVTRARRQMIVVCSIDPTEIKLTSKNDGPKRLRQFLQYARATSLQDASSQGAILEDLRPHLGRAKDQAALALDTDFEERVSDGLRNRGYEVDMRVGESAFRMDLAVVHPEDPARYIMGIECDGSAFRSARSVKERDVTRRKFLEEKGWKIGRVWSRSWWRDRERELDRICDAIGDALAENRSKTDSR